MTCIAGIALPNGEVWIAGDSAGTNSHSQQTIETNEKVFFVRNESGDIFLLGCTTSFRMIDLLKHELHPPPYDGGDLHRYMVVSFIKAVRTCLTDGAFAKKDDGREEGGTFLVGFRGRLFEIASDYQVSEARCGYNAVGSGDDLALGVLFATRRSRANSRLKLALEAAAYHNSDVREPCVIYCLAPAQTTKSLLQEKHMILATNGNQEHV